MIWSISSDKSFRRCQRQWFFRQVFGNANARKDRRRYEAYLLSKLQTISAVRGDAVDEILSEQLVPALNSGWIPTKTKLRDAAIERFDQKIAFAHKRPFQPTLEAPGKLPDRFTLLIELEYGDGVADADVERARMEITEAVEAVFTFEDELEQLRRADRVVAQRALMWKTVGQSVRAVPDVIAFFSDQAPIVLDWKVHFFGTADAARQLASYALALSHVNPHRDFPFSADGWPASRTRLWEIQLLKREIRKHEFSDAEYSSLEEQIARQAHEVALALHGRPKSSEFVPAEFPTAFEPRQCTRCQFKRLCWEQE